MTGSNAGNRAWHKPTLRATLNYASPNLFPDILSPFYLYTELHQVYFYL
ncbi:MAG: hypothetical protein GXY34_00850 [Syntrophomonadaceae bacterium]|nr:hypothetical protein [Syntrophomonadaceae bacterium]